MAAAVQQLSTTRYTNLDRNCGSHELVALALQKSPHDQLCEVLVQLRNLTLDPYQDVYRSHSSTSLNEPRNVSSTLREYEPENSGPALAQYESQTPAPAELVKIHNSEIKPLLDALLLNSDEESTSQHGDHVLTENEIQLDFLKLVAYGATNDFAGMDNPAWRAMTFRSLKTVLSPIMQSQAQDLGLWRHISQLQSLKPMAETYFRCAVESGDHTTVAQLLGWSEINIDLSNVVCTIDGLSLTPMEAAASLQNMDLVRILLQYQAEVNKKRWEELSPASCKCNLPAGGAVYHACMPFWFRRMQDGQRMRFEDVNRQLLLLLINAGGMICSSELRYIVSVGGGTLVQLFVNAPVPQNCRSLMAAGVLHEAIYQLDLTDQQDLLVSLRDANAGLQADFRYSDPMQYSKPLRATKSRGRQLDEEILYPACLIDIAAQRGQLETVKLLRSWQVPFTDSTLIAGIRSRDAALIQFLLEEGAPRMCFSRDYITTPLAEAVRVKDMKVKTLLGESSGHAKQSGSEDGLCALLAAAAEAGDEVLVDQTLAITCESFTRGNILGYALTRACKHNHLAVARELLESGASTSREHYTNVMGFDGWYYMGEACLCPCPLESAVTHRNEEMLELLLNHDVGQRPNDSTELSKLVIDWGSFRVAKLLLSAGVDLNNDKCLMLAIQQCSKPLVTLFLPLSGAEYHRSGLLDPIFFRYDTGGPLETAVRSSDEAMLRLVLQAYSGRSPASEPGAFAAALQYAPHLYQILLDEAFAFSMASDDTTIYETDTFATVWFGALNRRRSDIIHWLASSVDLWTPGLRLNPLKQAIEQEEYNVLDFVMSLGVSPNSTINRWHHSQSALIYAIKERKMGMIISLLKFGADINLPAKYNVKRTPLQQAAEIGDLAIIKLLLTEGADINSPPATRNGGTPIQLAAIRGFIGVVQYLQKHSGDLWASGSIVGGRTALEGAAEHGRFDMVHYLVSRRPPDLDQYGKAKQFALKNGHGAIADMLETMLQARMAELQPVIPRPPVLSPAVRRRHICSKCSASFTKASALRRHERGHQDTFAYRCLECEKCFRRKDTLDRHVDTQHVGVSHQCHVCGDEFSRQDTLSQHMRTKHREAAQVATASAASPIASCA